MKKLIKFGVIGVVLLLLVGGGIFLYSLNSIARAGTERVLSFVLDVPVTLEGASVKPWSGSVSLRGLKIGNPEGFKTDSAFAAREISVKLDLGSLRSDTIVIQNVTIGGPKVTLEQGLTHSNLGDLVKNAQRLSSGGAEKPAEKPETGEAAGKGVKLALLTLNDAQVALSAPILQGRDVTFPLGGFKIEDLGGEGGRQSVADAIRVFFERVLAQAVEQGGDAIPGDFRTVLQGDLGGVRERVGERLGGVREGVKNLLGR